MNEQRTVWTNKGIRIVERKYKNYVPNYCSQHLSLTEDVWIDDDEIPSDFIAEYERMRLVVAAVRDYINDPNPPELFDLEEALKELDKHD